MNKYIQTSLLFCIPALLQAQLSLTNNGATIKVASGTTLRVNEGSIENKNAAKVANDGNIYLDANFNQTSAATYTGSATSWLWFEGGGDQYITGNAVFEIAKLRVDNGNRLVLSAPVNVTSQIDLTNNGNIELGNFDLDFSGAAVTGYDANNYVVTNGSGQLRRFMVPGDVQVFPVGNSTFNPVTLTSLGADNDTYSVRVQDIVYDNGVAGNPETQNIVNRTWFVSEADEGGAVIDITVEWDETEELMGFDRSQSGLAHWDGSQWEHPNAFSMANNVGTARWTQTRSGQTSFSPFAVEGSQQVLPIELLSFDAQRINQAQVKLDWATASEINNRGFDIERMLDHETVFQKVGFVDGYGNSSNTINYNHYDDNSYPNVSYYRLRQVDFDGTVSYSEIRAVSGTGAHIDPVTLYPNPVKNSVNVRFGNLSATQNSARVRVLDMRGALVQEFSANIAAYQSFSIDTEAFASGSYLVEIRMNTGEQQTLRFIRE